MKDYIRLVGKGTGWEQCPQDGKAELWGLNSLAFTDKLKFDRLFIMDGIDQMPSVISGDVKVEDYINRLNELKIPVVGPYKYEEIPTSEAYPIEDVVREFGVPYFKNTISYMIAYALLRGAKKLELWGINQAAGTEYFSEKACVEYWLGFAAGMGVEVIIQGKHSELLRNKTRLGGNILYGYNTSFENFVRAKAKFGELKVKRLLAPDPTKYEFDLKPRKKEAVTFDVLRVKQLWEKFANHPEGRWIMPLNDCLNLARLIVQNKLKKALDLGTGIGASAAVMSEVGAEVHSVEQFPKCLDIAQRLVSGVKFYLSEPEVFSVPEIPYQQFARYKKLPEGEWDLVVVDGPGPWEQDGKVVELTSGDAFCLLDKIKPNGFIYVQGRRETAKILHKYYSDFVQLKQIGEGFALFQRNDRTFDPKLIQEKIKQTLKQRNYF